MADRCRHRLAPGDVDERIFIAQHDDGWDPQAM
jgi:hypothetical protein